MAKIESISFSRTDFSIPEHIFEYGKKFADYIYLKGEKIIILKICKLIQTSKKWTIDNLNDKFNSWAEKFEIEVNNEIYQLIRDSFFDCKTNDELGHLRGIILEAMIVGCYGGSKILLDESHFGWGAKVNIHLPSEEITSSEEQEQPELIREIKYNCIKKKEESNCFSRSTVDFGYWNGKHGKFFECKAQPLGIGCKELRYMENLKLSLNEYNTSHEIFFVCPTPMESIHSRLKSIDNTIITFQAFGETEIWQLREQNRKSLRGNIMSISNGKVRATGT